MQNKISTIGRYFYLNIYAYLLILLGIGIAFIPLYLLWKPSILIQAAIALIPIKAGIKILKRWKEKRRSYSILVRRNRNGLRADSFKEYMQAPCGRQLVKVVLKDLGEKEKYKELKREFVPSFGDRIKSAARQCKRKKTIVRFAGKREQARTPDNNKA